MTPSLPEVFNSIHVPKGAYWRRLLAFAGPGYLIAVGYMDPGNWATDIAGGSRYGYALLPAVVLSSLVAIFLQWLALRLGIASGMDLAQACRRRFSPAVSGLLWVTCEIAIIACDLAEVIGAAIALKLLFHLPLLIGIAITALDTLLLLALQKRGLRYVEAVVFSLLAVVGVCFAIELVMARPSPSEIVSGSAGFGGVLSDRAMLYVALGIFGATVMPHNLYLHSAVAQTRRFDRSDAGRREAIHFSAVDAVSALFLALLINAAILIMAAAVFHRAGQSQVAGLEEAYRLLSPLLGAGTASLLFAVALLASGQNSTLTGTMAGQIVMEGFLDLRMNPALRRLATRSLAVAPALLVVAVAGEAAAAHLLVFSQVVLSLQLGFAVVPLVMFTSDAKIMGSFVNSAAVRTLGWVMAALIVAVNLWLVVQTVG